MPVLLVLFLLEGLGFERGGKEGWGTVGSGVAGKATGGAVHEMCARARKFKFVVHSRKKKRYFI